jgi:ABC-2 type transport system permease protein
MHVSLAQLLAVVKKELRQTVRDRRMLVMLLLAPVLQLTLLGFAVDLEVNHIETAIVDGDRTRTSRELIAGLVADATLDVVLETDDPDGPLANGDAVVVVIVPPGLERDLLHGRPAQLQVLVDGTNPIQAQAAVDAALRYVQSVAIARSSERLEMQAGLTGQVPSFASIEIEPRILYNPSMKSPVYMVPGVAAVVLLIVTTIVTAMGIARERELGTIEQLLVTPMQPTILLLGKVLPFAGIGLVTAGMVIGVGTNVFDVPVRGSLLVLLVGTLLYLMSTLGTGIFISTMARTQQQAILGGFFFLMPAILLSGFMSPIDNMPDWVKPLTWINPVRYFVEILRAVLLKGAGFADVGFQLAALALFGELILIAGSMRFRKRLS